MKLHQMKKIFTDTAYIRTGGSPEELRCAEYLRDRCTDLGLNAWLEDFEVDMATMEEAQLLIDGKAIPCKGYFNAGSHDLEAPLYYLGGTDRYSLSQCRGKIVLMDGYLGYWKYQDLLDNGALGFITYSGDIHQPNNDIDQRELRAMVCEGKAKLPGVNINVKDAVSLVHRDAKTAHIVLRQQEYKGKSHNVVAELPGREDKWIVLSAHYDSTSLSQGAYDNMSGSVGLLGIAQALKGQKLRCGLRLVFCGSEERGLLGSKAYCAQHQQELDKIELNVNLDMIGCATGRFIACCSTEEKLCSYIEYMGYEMGLPVSTRQDVYSSDSTPFADKGVPALSFARMSAPGVAPIHCRHDTMKVMKMENMAIDIAFISEFVRRMASSAACPVNREIPQSVKEKLDTYLARKRPPEGHR